MGRERSSVTLRSPTRHSPLPGLLAPKKSSINSRVAGMGKGSPSLAQSSGASRVERREFGEFRYGPLGIQRPEGRLEHFHRHRAERRCRAPGTAPQRQKRLPTIGRVIREVPRCRQRDDAFCREQVGGSQGHCSAKTIADDGRCLANLPKKRQEQPFDMAGNAEFRALARRSPIEQQDAAAHPGNGFGQRNVRIQIEHVRRIDERRDEDHGRAATAAFAQHCPFHLAGDRADRSNCGSFSALIGDETGHGGPRHLRVALGGGADQFEEQWQRPRRVCMLQCTIIR